MAHVVENPEKFPILSRKLFHGEKIPWDIGKEKREIVRDFIQRMKEEMEENGFDWEDPEVRGQVAIALQSLAFHESPREKREQREPSPSLMQPCHTSTFKKGNQKFDQNSTVNDRLESFFRKFPLKRLKAFLTGKKTLLNLTVEESERLFPGPRGNYLFYIFLREAGFDPKFLSKLFVENSSYYISKTFVEYSVPFDDPNLPDLLIGSTTVSQKKYQKEEPIQILAHLLADRALKSDSMTFGDQIQLMSTAIYLDPSSYFLYYTAGNFHKENENYESAISLYRKAIQINPHDPFLYKNLIQNLIGSFLHHRSRTDILSNLDEDQLNEIITLSKKGLELDPENSSFHYFIGLAKLGLYIESTPVLLFMDIDEALEVALPHFKKAVELKTKNRIPHLLMGLYLLRKNPEDPQGLKIFNKGIHLYHQKFDNLVDPYDLKRFLPDEVHDRIEWR